jgi:hypothetical protein
MDSNKVKSFVTGKVKEITANYNSLTSDEEFIPFIEASLKEYADQGTAQFASTFTEFGETFTTEYDITGILNNATAYKIDEAVIAFAAEQNEKHYNDLINAYYFTVLTQINCLKENKPEESIFSTDIALSLLFACIYFPEDALLITDYLLHYIQAKESLFHSKTYENLLGKSELFPLAVFVLLSGLPGLPAGLKVKAGQINSSCSPAVAEAYSKAMAQVAADDEQTVKDWVNELAGYHIAHSKDDWTQAFNNKGWQYFPVEIMILLRLRIEAGKAIGFIDNPLVAAFIPYLQLPVKLDTAVQQLRNKIKN